MGFRTKAPHDLYQAFGIIYEDFALILDLALDLDFDLCWIWFGFGLVWFGFGFGWILVRFASDLVCFWLALA